MNCLESPKRDFAVGIRLRRVIISEVRVKITRIGFLDVIDYVIIAGFHAAVLVLPRRPTTRLQMNPVYRHSYIYLLSQRLLHEVARSSDSGVFNPRAIVCQRIGYGQLVGFIPLLGQQKAIHRRPRADQDSLGLLKLFCSPVAVLASF